MSKLDKGLFFEDDEDTENSIEARLNQNKQYWGSIGGTATERRRNNYGTQEGSNVTDFGKIDIPRINKLDTEIFLAAQQL